MSISAHSIYVTPEAKRQVYSDWKASVSNSHPAFQRLLLTAGFNIEAISIITELETARSFFGDMKYPDGDNPFTGAPEQEFNWLKQHNLTQCISSAYRHALALREEIHDADSLAYADESLMTTHLAAVVWNLRIWWYNHLAGNVNDSCMVAFEELHRYSNGYWLQDDERWTAGEKLCYSLLGFLDHNVGHYTNIAFDGMAICIALCVDIYKQLELNTLPKVMPLKESVINS